MTSEAEAAIHQPALSWPRSPAFSPGMLYVQQRLGELTVQGVRQPQQRAPLPAGRLVGRVRQCV